MSKMRLLLHIFATAAIIFTVSWFQIKPLGYFFITIFMFWIYQTRCSTSIEIIKPFLFYARFLQLYERSRKLRKEKPGTFCFVFSGGFILLATVGHMLSASSVVLQGMVGMVLSGLSSATYNLKISKTPKKYAMKWIDVYEHDVDEFLPEVNESNLILLQRASDHAVISSQMVYEDEKSDEIPSELLITESIPEIDEKSDTSSEDDLLIKTSDYASSTGFKKGYFKKDSSKSTSSSDDECLSNGLRFPNFSEVDSKNKSSYFSNYLLNSDPNSTILPFSLVCSLVAKTTDSSNSIHPKSITDSKRYTEEFSDESDFEFELINPDDLNNP